MPYTFAKQKEVTELNKWCLCIIHAIQRSLREFFTFDIRLVGSGEKRLVTMDDKGCFDLDYDLILQRDKQDLINKPKKIKELFIHAFNKELSKQVNGFKHVCDSTSVVKNVIRDDKFVFKFDVAIMVKGDDDSYYKLINDHRTGNYIWNRVRDSENYMERYLTIKHNIDFAKIKERYLWLKNHHEEQKDGVASFSIFLEMLNEFET